MLNGVTQPGSFRPSTEISAPSGEEFTVSCPGTITGAAATTGLRDLYLGRTEIWRVSSAATCSGAAARRSAALCLAIFGASDSAAGDSAGLLDMDAADEPSSAELSE